MKEKFSKFYFGFKSMIHHIFLGTKTQVLILMPKYESSFMVIRE